ncbi:MAG: hypothetical protein ACSHXD_00450 [Marinosulfonomonas sp.]
MAQAIRNLAFLVLTAGLAACSAPANVDAPRVPMGDFDLGLNVVVVNNPEVLPFSRSASDQEWKAKMALAMDERFGDYAGGKLYNIGVKVEAYALAIPGVPVLFTPKSALVIVVNIYDDAQQKKLNAEPKSFTVFESISAETMVSSGLTQSKDEQMTTLTQNAAKMIQDWILENPEWIGLPPVSEQQANVASDSTTAAAPGATAQ